jgi:hypothetical protein
MIGGAVGIDDMDLLRHGAMPVWFGGIRAPSTLGSFLRTFTCYSPEVPVRRSPSRSPTAGFPASHAVPDLDKRAQYPTLDVIRARRSLCRRC